MTIQKNLQLYFIFQVKVKNHDIRIGKKFNFENSNDVIPIFKTAWDLKRAARIFNNQPERIQTPGNIMFPNIAALIANIASYVYKGVKFHRNIENCHITQYNASSWKIRFVIPNEHGFGQLPFLFGEDFDVLEQ